MKKEIEPVFSTQERDLLDILPLLSKIVVKRLYKIYPNDTEDIVQETLKNLWKFFSQKNPGHFFSPDEISKIANTAVRNQMISFLRKKHREVLFSEMDEQFTAKIPDPRCSVEGNTNQEVRTQLVIIWERFQRLSIRQKYAFLLPNQAFITLLGRSGFCAIKEIAEVLSLSKAEFMVICGQVPLSDERIQILLESKFGLKLTKYQIWMARGKAKNKLLANLKI